MVDVAGTRMIIILAPGILMRLAARSESNVTIERSSVTLTFVTDQPFGSGSRHTICDAVGTDCPMIVIVLPSVQVGDGRDCSTEHATPTTTNDTHATNRHRRRVRAAMMD